VRTAAIETIQQCVTGKAWQSNIQANPLSKKLSSSSTHFESSSHNLQSPKKTFNEANDKSCGEIASNKTVEVVTQDMLLPETVRQAQLLDEGFVQDAV